MSLKELKSLDEKFKHIIRNYLLKFILLFLTYLIISFSSVYPTRLLGKIIDRMALDNSLSRRVIELIVFYISIRLMNLILNFISRYGQEAIRANLESDLRMESINKLLSVRNLNDLRTLQSSQYVTRIFETIQSLVDSILNLIVWFGKSLPILIFTFYFIFQINYIIAFLIIPFVMLMAILTSYISRKQKSISKREIESKAGLIDFFHQIVESFETIRIFNSRSYMLDKTDNLEENWKTKRIRKSMIFSLSFLSLSLFGIIITSLILLLSTINTTTVKTGEITSLILYTGNVFILIMDVFNNLIVFSELENSLERFNKMFPQKDKKLEAVNNNIINWNIELKNISFNYDDKEVIKNMSFLIPEGSKVAIVGKNGSGKSTLLKIISGLYRPSKGEVYIGGISLKNIGKEFLGENLAYAQQDPYIYNDTIYNNIALADKYSENKIKEVIEICNMKDLTEKLSEDTILYNNAANLSGGQRQKIGLARTIIRSPKVLLLDEYTSSLDIESQKHIFDYLISLDKTLVFITHDYSFLREMDLIIYLDSPGNYYIDSHDNLLKELKAYRDYLSSGND